MAETTIEATSNLNSQEIRSKSRLVALKHEEYTNLTSPYLMGGYKQDNLSIHLLRHSGDYLELSLKVEGFCADSDGQFHLSTVTFALWTQQAVIMLVHLSLGLRQRSDIVRITSSENAYSKIVDTQDIKIESFIKSKEIKDGNYVFHIETLANAGCFKNTSTVLLPLG